MKLIPASSAVWMIRIDSSWSGLPHAPNIIAPRQNLLTDTPVRPNWRCSIGSPFLAPRSSYAGPAYETRSNGHASASQRETSSRSAASPSAWVTRTHDITTASYAGSLEG